MTALHNVSKRFADKQVLRDFSLALPDDGTVALLGPSGCGKTTLLRMLAGLERPDSGEVVLPADAVLAVAFQEDRLIDVLTARENVLAVLSGSEDAVACADKALACVGLADAAGLYPRELSGGMRRRVALARAVAYGGNLRLFDEPLQGLDADTKSAVMDYAFAPRPGILTVWVTHDPAEALAAADHILLLSGPPLAVRGTHTIPLSDRALGRMADHKAALHSLLETGQEP